MLVNIFMMTCSLLWWAQSPSCAAACGSSGARCWTTNSPTYRSMELCAWLSSYALAWYSMQLNRRINPCSSYSLQSLHCAREATSLYCPHTARRLSGQARRGCRFSPTSSLALESVQSLEACCNQLSLGNLQKKATWAVMAWYSQLPVSSMHSVYSFWSSTLDTSRNFKNMNTIHHQS